MTQAFKKNAVVAALLGKCPQCGEGALFSGYLKLAPLCRSCGADFSIADSGDGPAVFVMFLVGAIVVPVAMIMEFSLHSPAWAIVGVTGALAIGLSLWMLPAFKAVLFALQWKNKASEANFK